MYYDYSESVKTIAPHRVLAINRGEKEDFLKVKVEINNEKVINYIINEYVNDKNLKNKEVIVSAIEDSPQEINFPINWKRNKKYSYWKCTRKSDKCIWKKH